MKGRHPVDQACKMDRMTASSLGMTVIVAYRPRSGRRKTGTRTVEGVHRDMLGGGRDSVGSTASAQHKRRK